MAMATLRKKHFFIHLPPWLVTELCRQANLPNPPDEADIETVAYWILTGALSGEMISDATTNEKPKQTLRRLKKETKWYIQDIKKRG